MKIKKVLAIILALSLIAVVFAACGKTEDPTTAPDTTATGLPYLFAADETA